MTTSYEPQKRKLTEVDSVQQGEGSEPQADLSIMVLRLQRTLGNRAVIELLKPAHQAQVQRMFSLSWLWNGGKPQPKPNAGGAAGGAATPNDPDQGAEAQEPQPKPNAGGAAGGAASGATMPNAPHTDTLADIQKKAKKAANMASSYARDASKAKEAAQAAANKKNTAHSKDYDATVAAQAARDAATTAQKAANAANAASQKAASAVTLEVARKALEDAETQRDKAKNPNANAAAAYVPPSPAAAANPAAAAAASNDPAADASRQPGALIDADDDDNDTTPQNRQPQPPGVANGLPETPDKADDDTTKQNRQPQPPSAVKDNLHVKSQGYKKRARQKRSAAAALAGQAGGAAAGAGASETIENPQWVSACNDVLQGFKTKPFPTDSNAPEHKVTQKSVIQELPAIRQGNFWRQGRHNNSYLKGDKRIFVEVNAQGLAAKDAKVAIADGLTHDRTRAGAEIIVYVWDGGSKFTKHVKK